MALRALDSTSFGFQTRCFACDPHNERGLGITFYHDDDAELVTAQFSLGPEYSGAPRLVHGGLVLTVLDEAMAWAVIVIAERFGVVRTTSASFRRPVEIDQPHRVEGMVEERGDTSVTARAQVFNAQGRRCAEARARFAILSEKTAQAAIGGDLSGNMKYLRAKREGRP